MPLVFIEVIEDAFERLVGDLDVLAVALGLFEFMYVEQTAVEIRDIAKEFFKVGCAVFAALAETLVKQAEKKVAVETVELVLALLLLATLQPVAEVIAVSVEEAFSLNKIDEHQPVEHDRCIPFPVGDLADAGDELEESIPMDIEVAVELLSDALNIEAALHA